MGLSTEKSRIWIQVLGIRYIVLWLLIIMANYWVKLDDSKLNGAVDTAERQDAT